MRKRTDALPAQRTKSEGTLLTGRTMWIYSLGWQSTPATKRRHYNNYFKLITFTGIMKIFIAIFIITLFT